MILPSWEEGTRFLPPWSFLLRDNDGECFFVEKDGRAPEVADTSSSEGPSLSMFTMVVVQGQCLIYSVMGCWRCRCLLFVVMVHADLES